jgi:hypothetical protein
MSPLIITPTVIDDPLYEGTLTFVEPTVEAAVVKGGGAFTAADVRRAAHAPVVTLGRPRCLGQFGPDYPLPAEAKKLAEKADYFLVRLACSFRPQHDSQIDYTKLSAFLQARASKTQAIAFDMYPRSVYKPIKGELKVEVSPGLKFAEVAEVSMGQVAATIQFQRLQPVIVGSGVQQADPCWEFEEHYEEPVRGSRFLYLIIERPHGVKKVRIILDITADVTTKHGLLAAAVKEKDKAHLSQVVCEY